MPWPRWSSGLLALIEGRVTPEVATAALMLPTMSNPEADPAASAAFTRAARQGSIAAPDDVKSAFQGTNDVFACGWGDWGQDGLADAKAERVPLIVKVSLLDQPIQVFSCKFWSE